MSGANRNDSEWVRQSVIDSVRDGGENIARSGAWVAEYFEKHGEVRVSRVDEVIDVA